MVRHSPGRSGTTTVTETGDAIGLDVGLASFVVDSVGNEIENSKVDKSRSQEHTHRRDGTARSAHRVETSTSHISDASLGDDVGSHAQQGAVVRNSMRYIYNLLV
jgi:hypothetical protein